MSGQEDLKKIFSSIFSICNIVYIVIFLIIITVFYCLYKFISWIYKRFIASHFTTIMYEGLPIKFYDDLSFHSIRINPRNNTMGIPSANRFIKNRYYLPCVNDNINPDLRLGFTDRNVYKKYNKKNPEYISVPDEELPYYTPINNPDVIERDINVVVHPYDIV